MTTKVGTSTLSNSGVTAGTYGTANTLGQFTVDATGRITNVTNVSIAIPTVVGLSNTTLTLIGGGAGTIVYQSAANVTAFLSAGSSGQVLLSGGTNAPTWGTLSNSAVGLAYTANVQFLSLGIGTSASGLSGEIRASNDITAFYSSDISLKENIVPIANALSKVEAIGGKTFDWKQAFIEDRGGEDGYFMVKHDFGVIAQDVEAVFPEAVRTRASGIKVVDYAKLSALAFQAIVELKQELDQLKSK